MTRNLAIVALGAIALLSGPLAYAKKDKDPSMGGNSPQHMSQPGQMNSNSPALGQDKGSMRADDRKSDQGMMHDNDVKKGKAKARGHGK